MQAILRRSHVLLASVFTVLIMSIDVRAKAEPPESIATSTESQTEQNPAVDQVQKVDQPVNTPIPNVLSVFPADGEKNVPSETVLKIRFNQSMRPRGISLKWDSFRLESGFRLSGPITYDEQNFEFSFPVCLKPGVEHKVGLNHDEGNRNFASAIGVQADAFEWRFDTSEMDEAMDGPQIIAVSPKPDTEVALITLLRIQFDKPMVPEWYGLSTDGKRMMERHEIVGQVTYDPERYEFEIPISFPANWDGVLTFDGFRGTDGKAARPRKIPYRTLRKLVSNATDERIAKAVQSDTLISLLQRMRTSCSNIESAHVTATSAMEFATLDWSYQLNQSQARFAKQGKKYFGDVSQCMNSSFFQVGSDGGRCWFRFGDDVTVVPSAEVAQQNVSIAGGFSDLTLQSPQATIEHYQLEHVGLQTIGDRRFHVLRSWANVKSWWERMQRVTGFQEWLIDDETALLFQITSGRVHRTQFVYEAVNAEIPDDVFAVPMGKGITLKAAAPLGDGYNLRFLNVIDGTNGRMSLRWGQKGAKGVSSSGLN